MSVRNAILGILIKRSRYPYQLSIDFEKLTGYTWQLNSGQLYQTVYKLEREGLVERTECNPNVHGPRWVFQITDKGRDAYKRSRLTKPQRVKPLRNDLLLEIALSESGDAPRLLDTINTRARLCKERLREYTELEAGMVPADKASSWEEVGATLSLTGALEQVQSELRWLTVARKTVERFTEAGATRNRIARASQ